MHRHWSILHKTGSKTYQHVHAKFYVTNQMCWFVSMTTFAIAEAVNEGATHHANKNLASLPQAHCLGSCKKGVDKACHEELQIWHIGLTVECSVWVPI